MPSFNIRSFSNNAKSQQDLVTETTNATVTETPEDDIVYPDAIHRVLIAIGLSLSVLLVALDNAILATAIPTITSHFNSLDDVGWYGSAFLIALCALQPTAGKIFQYFSLKWSYLIFLGLFELGSLLCGVAVSSNMLIVGRAVAGLGASGLFSGALTIIAHTVPLETRPIFIGIVASSSQIANVLGPLVGGALTQHTTWRWCFYINLPCGAVTASILFFFFHPPKRVRSSMSLREKLGRVDIPGLAIFVPGILMLLLAIEWGGSKYAWHSATIIGLLCGSAGTLAVFMAWQWHQQSEASIPPKIFLQRTVFTSSLSSLFTFGSIQIGIYYLPIWFQVIKDASPTKSGVMFLPTVISCLIFTLVAGGLVTKLGYYNPWMLIGTIFLSIACGLFSTFHTDTGSSKWIGYQVIFGAGTGAAMPMCVIAVMAVLPQDDIPVGTAIIVFFQFLGGSIVLAIAENLFSSQLMKALVANVPQLDAGAIVAAGAESVRTVVSLENLQAVLEAYNTAITRTLYVGVAAGGAAFVASIGVQWINVKGKDLMSAAAA
ncbi:major facilitator superfamily domain-containing protein [Xylogone sp. PMI_703]|nr:major facilitator superfamily domain-containing protein [Xylogone sp. PMI_703]